MVMEYRSFISVLFVVSELKIMAFGRVILYNAFFKLLCIMCNVLYYDQPHNILGTFKYMMTSHCIGCIWERGAFTMKFAKNLSFTNTTRYRSSSTLSFASDRDPAEAEEMPVHRHMSKKHRRANMVYACGLNATGKSQCRIKRKMRLVAPRLTVHHPGIAHKLWRYWAEGSTCVV